MKNWIALSLATEVIEFNPFHAICQKSEPSDSVYCCLEGSISVVIARKKEYYKSFLDENSVTSIIKGQSFGEIGVIYNRKRYC